jgi:hypothetical protein
MKFLSRFIGGIFVALMVSEVLLRFLPVSTATHTDYYLTSSIITYPPYHKFVMATGWNLSNAHYHQANNYGFLTNRDFFENTDAIAVIGDSYVEANMLEESERVGRQLENKLANRPVYALGGPGSSLLDYVERARFAQSHFGVKDFVFIIELGDVRQTLCGSNNIHGPCIDSKTLTLSSNAKPVKVDFVKKVLRESALVQYLFSQLRLKPETLAKQLFADIFNKIETKPSKKIADSENVDSVAVDRIVYSFLSNLPKNKDGHVILVFDSYRDCSANETPVRNRFIEMTQQLVDIEIIDTKPIFCEFSESTKLNLNVSPADGHWNRLAHGLVAEAVASKFTSSYDDLN